MQVGTIVRSLQSSPAFRRAFPGQNRPIAVADGRGRRRAGGSALRRYITVPKWARFEKMVLHEVAHVLAPRFAHHGPDYAAVYFRLIALRWGPHYACLFEGALNGRGGRITQIVDNSWRYDKFRPW